MSRLQLALAATLSLAACFACACAPADVPPPKEPDPVLDAPPDEHRRAQTWATLDISSSPPGMPVMLNGKAIGKTPITIDKLPAGNYDVTYKDEANGDVTMPVELGEGEYRNVKHNVVPRADRPAPSDSKN